MGNAKYKKIKIIKQTKKCDMQRRIWLIDWWWIIMLLCEINWTHIADERLLLVDIPCNSFSMLHFCFRIERMNNVRTNRKYWMLMVVHLLDCNSYHNLKLTGYNTCTIRVLRTGMVGDQEKFRWLIYMYDQEKSGDEPKIQGKIQPRQQKNR